MIIIRRLLVLFLIAVCCALIANADDNKSFKYENNTYSYTGKVKTNSTPTATGYNWIDSKGIQYPIYISESGSCYIIKVSKKTNKEYKQYLGSDISQDICKRLNKEYKAKKK